ncbi:hypothetical protein GCM10022222_58860 [Amycolatopsis ultiminotia]|uniref:Uncharacterized protein n=1 Tax=Amycolatopsis ultiminotia TaxID=543629 RepID=A0ABP6XH82_9PSEU
MPAGWIFRHPAGTVFVSGRQLGLCLVLRSDVEKDVVQVGDPGHLAGDHQPVLPGCLPGTGLRDIPQRAAGVCCFGGSTAVSGTPCARCCAARALARKSAR